MGTREVHKPAVGRAFTWPMTSDPHHFSACPCKGEMDRKTNVGFHCLCLILFIGIQSQLPGKRNNVFSCLCIDHLGHTITKHSKMSDQLSRIALMSIEHIAAWMFLVQLIDSQSLQGFEDPLKHCVENYRSLFFKPLKNSIDCKFIIWYSELKDEFDFKFVNRAIPPCGGSCYH